MDRISCQCQSTDSDFLGCHLEMITSLCLRRCQDWLTMSGLAWDGQVVIQTLQICPPWSKSNHESHPLLNSVILCYCPECKRLRHILITKMSDLFSYRVIFLVLFFLLGLGLWWDFFVCLVWLLGFFFQCEYSNTLVHSTEVHSTCIII